MTTIYLDAEARDALAVISAGVGARLYVRGAMDPLFNSPHVRDSYAKALAKSSPSLAVEFLRGWSEHHDTVPEPVVWHRFIGGVALEVAA